MSVATADELKAKAEKKLKGNFFSFGSKVEDAQDLFKQAATYYKANQQWEDAGNAYLRAQDCAAKLKSAVDRAALYQDAALMFKKVDVWKAAECLQKALEIWDQTGRAGKGGKLAQELAEMFHKTGDHDNAIEWFGRAAEYYRGEGAVVTASQCVLQEAHLRAERGDYDRALPLLESIAEQYLSDHLLRSSAPRVHFLALCCRMARGDPPDQVRAAFEGYVEKDVLFVPETREHALATRLLAALDAKDPPAFEEAIAAHNAVYRLDALHTQLMEAAAKRFTDMC